MSYLGKISALVTVNTGDFAPKLNAAAKEVRSFAKTVESNIGSSMRAATKSLDDIYTPLQKFERSLRAASSMKLSFAGFPGAIRSIDELKQRMTSLNNRQIDVILKTSGLKDVESFRDVLTGLRSREFDLLVKVGGIDKLNELRESMLTGEGKIEVVAETKAAIERVAELKARLVDIQNNKVPVHVAVEGVEAATAKLGAAKKAMMDFVVAGSGKGVKASTYLDDLNTQLAVSSTQLARLEGQQRDREEKLSAVQGSQAAMRQQRRNINAISPDQTSAIAAKEKEVADLAGTVANLQRLVDEYAAAKNELSSAKAVATDGGLKQTEKEIRSAERALKDLKEEALAQVSAKLGFQLDMKGLESLLSGEATSQAQQLGEKLRAMGISAADAGKMVKGVMDALGQSDQSAGISKLQRLQSAAEALGKPMGEVRDKLVAAGKGIEAGFGGALTKTQGKIEALKDSIARLESEGESNKGLKQLSQQFMEIEAEIDSAGNAVNRFAEVRGKLAGMKTGEELVFKAPALSESLDRSSQLGSKAAALPASAIQSNPKLVANLAEINRLSEKAANTYAKLEAELQSGSPPNAVAQKYLDNLLGRLKALQDETEKDIQIHLDKQQADKDLDALLAKLSKLYQEADFTITGKLQNSGQVEAEIARIIGQLDKLDDAQRVKISPQVNAAISSLTAQTPAGTPDIAAMQAAFDALKAAFGTQLQVKVDTDEATKKVNDLRAALGSIASTLTPTSTPMDALKKSAEAARAAVDKVADATKRAQLQSRLNSVSANITALADPKNPALAGMSPKQIARMQARQSAKLGQITADAGVASAPTSKDIFGDMIGSSAARIDALKSKITGVQSGIAALPTPLQANMLPALAKVRDAFAKLGASPAAKDLLAATKAADNLEKTLKRAQAASQFHGTFRSFINDNAAKSYAAQLQQIRQGLVAVGATAGGPVAAAVNQYSKALQDAGKAGRLGTQATKQEMADLLKKIEQAAVATGLMTKKQAAQFAQSVQRAGKGDVGRMGADKFSLALNQAAFAVDDFMSSTGGIEFKLRAISNNITQLGFVIGGTYGLFVGLGAVIGGQLAVGILKFINNGRTAEDQTKALNDSLARQKNLVEELAEAFGSLTEAVSRGGLSAGAQRAADFDKQLTDTKKKQKELRREQAAVLDPDVQRERAQQGAYQKQLEASTDIGTRIDLEQRIRQSKEREKIAIDSAAEREPATAAEAADVISRSGQILFERRTRGEEVVTPEDAATLTSARSRADAALAAGSPVEIRRALEAQREELGGISDDPRVSEQIRQLQVLIQSLDGPVEKALDELSNQIVQASRGVAVGIESAQKDVEDAIRRGVRGAADFQAALDNTSKQLRDAENQLVEAQKIEGDPERREAEIRRAEDRIGDIKLRRDAIREQAREVRLGRTFGGERTEKALSDIQGNERFANEYAGLTARLRAAVDKEMEARRLLEESIASGDSAEQEAARAALEAAQAEGDLAAAAAEAAKAIEEAFSRLRKILTNALADSERLADTAQQRFTEDPTAENRANRDAAERQLIADREKVAKANNALDAKRSEVAASDPQIAMIDDEMADIRERREQLAEQARIDGTEADPREMERLANREAELMAERERRLADLTKAEQGQIDTLAQETAARKKLIDAALAQYDAEIARGKKRDEEALGADRQRQQVDAAMGQSQSQYEARRQEYIRNPSQQNRQRLDEAERRMRADEERKQEIQDDMDAAERGFQERDDIKGKRKDIERREKRRAALIAKSKEEDRELTGPEKAEIDAIDEANREDRTFIRGERANDGGIKSAEKKGERFARQQEVRAGADRGRDLNLTDRERKRKEIEEGVGFDIRARAAELKSQGINPKDFMDEAIAEQGKLLAPMFAEFGQERENALLQGPSRAALQASDITSSQGQAELNRLLRGDDPAKDVNLAELRKQSGYLADLVNAVKNNPLPVIN